MKSPTAEPPAASPAPAFWTALPDADAVKERIRRMCRMPNWVPAWEATATAAVPAREPAPAPPPEPAGARPRARGPGRTPGALGRRTVALQAYCLELHAEGKSLQEIADATGLHRTTVGRLVPTRSKAEVTRLQWQRRRERAA